MKEGENEEVERRGREKGKGREPLKVSEQKEGKESFERKQEGKKEGEEIEWAERVKKSKN